MKSSAVKKLLAAALTMVLGVSCMFAGNSFRSAAASDSYVSNKDCGSKKGLQIDFNIMSDVEDLGISEAFINIEFEKLLEKDPATASPGSMIDYTYNGTTIHLHKETAEAYDMAVKRLTAMGANVTVAFINNEYDPEHFAYLYYVGAGADPSGVAYFAFDTREGSQGQKTVQAVCNYIAGRYDGSKGVGKISNFIVGNEINDNLTYNNVGPMEFDQYVSTYYQTFKTFYDALRAANSSAQVYFPLEYQWAGSIKNTSEYYRGKDFVDKFNSLSKADGNIDWNIAYHPYSNPILTANVLYDNMASTNAEGVATGAGDVTDDPNTTFITMKNLDVLTNYMQQGDYLKKDGKVRSIILSEQGYSSKSNLGDSNETSQAANIAYAYYKAEMNPYIDAFILYEQVTIADKLNGSNFDFGLWNSDNDNKPTTKKPAYYMYKYIDTDQSEAATNFALTYFGIDKWSRVIPGFDINKIYGYGKTITNGNLLFKDAFDYADDQITEQNVFRTYPSGPDGKGHDINLDQQGHEVSNSVKNDGATVIEQKMADGKWTPEYAVATDITMADYGNDNNGGAQQYHPYGGIATDPKVFYINYQGIKYDPATPLDLSSEPYLGFEFMTIPKSTTDDSKLELRVRVKSNEHVYDANAIIPQDQYYSYNVDNVAIQKRFAGTFFVNLSSWNYKNAVTEVEVWIRDTKDNTAYDGYISVQNLMKSNKDHGATALDIAENTGLIPINLTEPTMEGYNMMYRLYNPTSGEHFYTADKKECALTMLAGWKYEGYAWFAPQEGDPVYRLYNPNVGDHHYTTKARERDALVNVGWKFEGIAWCTTNDGDPMYRLYNPNATTGSHHYTTSSKEVKQLVNGGWKDEGIGWYGKKVPN